MRQRLLRLVFLVPVLSVGLAGVLVLVSLRLGRDTFRAAGFTAQLEAIDRDECTAAPSTWGWASGEVSIFAYDRSGRSSNPAAPPIEQDLLHEAISAGHSVYRMNSGQITWVASAASTGPCAVLRGTSRSPEPRLAPRFLAVLVTSITGGMLLAAAGAYGFVVIPLRTRISDLARAARRVGSASFAPQPASEDALGNIAEVLAQSHRRIVGTREALEKRNRALEEHLAGIAHDLRTPLLSMHLALEAVADAPQEALHSEVRRALSDVVYLSSLVENLHQATRLRHEVDVVVGEVDLSDLVRRLERRFVTLGRHSGVAVAASMPESEVRVACSPALAERAVANLVQNAVEHNESPGHVAIRLAHTDSGRGFELVVADDGPGLADEMLASLQHETFLVEEARPRGPGLGMLITQEVSRRAGWSVTYERLTPTGLEVRLAGPTVSPEKAITPAGESEL